MAALRVLTPRRLFGHPVEHVDPDALAIDAYDIACSHVYEIRLPEEGKRTLIRTDDPLAPRAYVGSGVLYVLTNCGVAVWSPTMGMASHGVPLPDSAVQTRHGMLVIHQIGCIWLVSQFPLEDCALPAMTVSRRYPGTESALPPGVRRRAGLLPAGD
jgi:hypothetical protein